MPTYRVFTQRTYRAVEVEWFDVVAATRQAAGIKAKQAVNRLYPDPRIEVTDSGWEEDGRALKVREPGAWARGKYAMREVAKDVYQVATESLPDDPSSK